MLKKGISNDLIAQFDFPKADSKDPEVIFGLINQMDNILSIEQRLAVMEELGCAKKGKGADAHKEFGQSNKDKTLFEKVTLLKGAKGFHRIPCTLNGDGTISAFWSYKDGDKYLCICPFKRRLIKEMAISPTFCGCCGGHARFNLQNALGVKITLIKIVSSPIGSKGEKHCEFLFQVEENK